MMIKAEWNGVVVAQSNETRVVEGNHYFPPESLNRDALSHSDTTSVCGWKGTAKYYHVKAGDEINRDAAWYYPEPKEKAADIRDHVAFWRGVTVSTD